MLLYLFLLLFHVIVRRFDYSKILAGIGFALVVGLYQGVVTEHTPGK